MSDFFIKSFRRRCCSSVGNFIIIELATRRSTCCSHRHRPLGCRLLFLSQLRSHRSSSNPAVGESPRPLERFTSCSEASSFNPLLSCSLSSAVVPHCRCTFILTSGRRCAATSGILRPPQGAFCVPCALVEPVLALSSLGHHPSVASTVRPLRPPPPPPWITSGAAATIVAIPALGGFRFAPCRSPPPPSSLASKQASALCCAMCLLSTIFL